VFSVRRAVAADSPAIFDVHVGAITRICAADYTPEEIEGWLVNKKPDGYVSAIEANDFFVATAADRVVGFSEFEAQSAEIRAVYVHPDFVRRGLGALLLRTAEDAARARGVTRVHLRSTLNAVAFYQARGYVVEAPGSLQLSNGGALRYVLMHRHVSSE